MKKLIVVFLIAFISVNYAAKKPLKPVALDNKISKLGDPSVVYVFTEKGLATSFRNYGIKCLKYKKRNPE